MRCAIALLAAAAFVVVGVACGSAGSKTTATTATPPATQPRITVTDLRGRKTVEVLAKDNFFQPDGIRIDPGTTVTWRNAGAAVHNVQPSSDLADFGGTTRFGVQASGFAPGATYSYTFSKPGTYNYSCTLHTGMIGQVVVG